METKPTNPKDAFGSAKIPFHLWPETATVEGALAMLDGALKYGRSNWRHSGVKASIYYDAARRHLNAWFEGEEFAKDSGVTHLGHLLACVAIIIDAKHAGMLVDDRMIHGGYHGMLYDRTKMVTEVMMNQANTEKQPHHFTINDSPPSRPANAIQESHDGDTLRPRNMSGASSIRSKNQTEEGYDR